jgi:hypothetical protein
VNIIAATDLLFPGRQDPIGHEPGRNIQATTWFDGVDRLRYVVWVDAGRPFGNGRGQGFGGNYTTRPELAPRTALHLAACRNGQDDET